MTVSPPQTGLLAHYQDMVLRVIEGMWILGHMDLFYSYLQMFVGIKLPMSNLERMRKGCSLSSDTPAETETEPCAKQTAVPRAQ